MEPTTKQKECTIDQLVLEAVQNLPEMRGKTLIYVSVVGSRSKRLASMDSDYDVKAVILHNTADYLLQKVTRSKSFTTKVVHPYTGNAVEVEGTLVDFLTMKNYILISNQAAYDAFYGIPLYETPGSHYLRELFAKTYNPKPMVDAFQGLLRAEQKGAAKKGRQTQIKYVTNMVYYASAVHVFASTAEAPGSDAFKLLEMLPADPALKEQIRELYRLRQADKSRTVEDVEPFQELLESALNIEFTKKNMPNELLLALQEESNRLFLSLVST